MARYLAQKDGRSWNKLHHTREDLEKKGPKAFVVPRGLRRFVELSGGELTLKEEAIREEARYDGKWVLRTNTSLSNRK